MVTAALIGGVAGCDVVRVGARCRTNQFARSGDQVVACRGGRWVRTGATVAQVAQLVVRILAARTTTAPGGTPTLAVSTVVANLNKPWDIAFTPDGTMLFTEKSGQINALLGGAKVTMADPPDSITASEGGMMGLAVDPAFNSNRRIYTCFLSNIPGGVGDVRVVRFTVGSDYRSLSDRTDIVTGLPVNTIGQAGRHSGCRPRFGNDGFLYVGTGDAAMGINSQSTSSLGGKVLRVTTDGAGAPGNPGGGWDSRIFTIGHRNVQGLALRPGTNQLFSVEHGPDKNDEVNRIVGGANYGWTPGGGTGGYNEGFPMTNLVAIPSARTATWSSGDPTIAPSGATFLSGSQWRDWNGLMIVAVLKDAQLRLLNLDAAGDNTLSQGIALTGKGRLRSVVEGPDGSIYVATDENPGQIFRVTPS